MSSFWWLDSRIQFAKKDSNILNRVGVGDIGQKPIDVLNGLGLWDWLLSTEWGLVPGLQRH